MACLRSLEGRFSLRWFVSPEQVSLFSSPYALECIISFLRTVAYHPRNNIQVVTPFAKGEKTMIPAQQKPGNRETSAARTLRQRRKITSDYSTKPTPKLK